MRRSGGGVAAAGSQVQAKFGIEDNADDMFDYWMGLSGDTNDPALMKIRQLAAIDVATDCLEDQALAAFGSRQAMVTVKGVDDNFDRLTHINEILIGDGEFQLHAADMHYGIPGIRLAEKLGTGITYEYPMTIYAPQREGQLNMADPTTGFREDELYSPGVLFCVRQAKYDKNYIITSLEFARNLFQQEDRISSLELRLKPGSNFDRVKAEIQQIAGDRFYVRDRFEQQDDTFKIMKIEKFIAYIFLTFILMVACFNIIGSLSMLIIEKKDDVVTLRNLGASDRQITRIFLFEGRLISIIGAVVGILLGLLLCWLQQTFGSFVVNAYPVSVHPEDIVLVFVTVILVGWLAVWYPVRYFSKRLLQ